MLTLFPLSVRRAGLKKTIRYILLCLLVALFIGACGYHNPNVYTGPDQAIYLQNWKNRTSKLGLDATIYQYLVRWYQNSSAISITKKKEGANLILAGEIVSISLPSLSYNSDNVASEVRIRLKVRYVMKDLESGKILIEEPGETWSESYLVGESTSETRINQNEALLTIVNDLSQKIYQKTIVKFQDQ